MKDYCGCEGEPFDESGELSQSGEEAYNKLIGVVYALEGIGLLPNASHIVDELDEIVSSDGSAY